MLDVLSEILLERATWADPKAQEAWTATTLESSRPLTNVKPNVWARFHEASTLLPWLQDDSVRAIENGGFRLVICYRTETSNVSIGKDQFKAIRSSFKLCAATLASTGTAMGHCSRTTKTHKGADGEVIRTAAIVFRNPRKFQLGDWLLSLTYDIPKRRVSAFMHGRDHHTYTLDPMRKWILNTTHGPKAGTDPQQPLNASMLRSLRRYFEHSEPHHSHPLLIPTILLTIHLARMRGHCENQVDAQVVLIEEAIGASRNPTLADIKQEDVFGNTDFEKIKMGVKGLTIRLNTLLTESIILETNSEWLVAGSKFLLETLDEWEHHGIITPEMDVDSKIRETLDSHMSTARGIQSRTRQSKARLESQMNVLYSMIAQTDNRLSAQMAASTGRDSAAMKTLAFLAALFLPGTFVASLFSMSMFDWKSGGDNSDINNSNNDVARNRIVSPYFWIYWAVAVPLTAFVIGGWRLWWTLEKRAYDNEVLRAIHGSNHQAVQKSEFAEEAVSGLKGSFWKSRTTAISERWGSTLSQRKKHENKDDVELSNAAHGTNTRREADLTWRTGE